VENFLNKNLSSKMRIFIIDEILLQVFESKRITSEKMPTTPEISKILLLNVCKNILGREMNIGIKMILFMLNDCILELNF